MSQVLTPIMIIENTQLGKVVSLLKGLERHFYDEDEKSIFYLKQFRAFGFYTRKGDGNVFYPPQKWYPGKNQPLGPFNVSYRLDIIS